MLDDARKPLGLVATAVATAVVIAACGGSAPPPGSGSSQANGSHRALAAAGIYRYPACMRSHGVANFPDPTVSDGGQKVAIRVTPSVTNSPAFKSAQQACAKYLPNGGPNGGPNADLQNAADAQARKRAILAFARCLRAHGFPNFPDPTAEGQLSREMIASAGINLHQPALLRAGLTCVGVTRGEITAADVEQAVNGPDGQGTQSSGSPSAGGG